MGLLHRSGVCILALIAGAAALQFEPAAMRNLAFDNGDQRVTVAAVRVPLWSAAWAQSAENVTLENVSLTLGPAVYEAQKVELSGLAQSRAEIEALFSPSSTEPVASRLARISAKQITIPEARVRETLGSETRTAIYRNVVFNEVVQGRAASVTVEAMESEAAPSSVSSSFRHGQASVSDLDLQALASLYEVKADASSAPLNRIYGVFSIEDFVVVEKEDGTEIRIAHMSGRDFMARPTKDSWAGAAALFAEIDEKDKPSSEETARFLATAADLVDAFDIGFAEATGIEIKDIPKESTQDGPSSSTGGRIDRISYTGATGSQPANARLEGLEFGEPGDRVRIDALSLTGFSFEPAIQGLKALQGKSLENLNTTEIRGLIPTLGTLRLSGLDIDISDPGGTDAEPGRVKVSLKDFELTANEPVNAVPTNIRLGVTGLALALPPDSTDEGIRELLALGYENIDMSLLVAAKWNEAGNEIVLEEVAVQGQEMGRLSLTGRLGNVTKDVFDADTAVASVALMDATAKSFDVVVENKGLFERYLDRMAKEQNTTPEALRRTYASATALVMPAVIGNSESAKNLSRAIARFIAQPGTLTINAQAKDPSGLGIVDAVLASEPKDIIEKLDINAKAE